MTACVDRRAEIGLGGLLHLLQDEGGNLRGRIALAVGLDPGVAVRRLDDLVGDELLVLLDHRVVIAAADQALDREEGALRVGDRLALRRLADQPLAVAGEGDDRRRGARPFRVLDDFRVLAVHDRDARIGRAEVDTDYLSHSSSPFGRPIGSASSGTRFGPHMFQKWPRDGQGCNFWPYIRTGQMRASGHFTDCRPARTARPQPPRLNAASAAMLTMSESFAAERDDLHRLVEADEERADHGRAAEFLQQLGRDRGRVEGRHDQDVRRAGQAAERIGRHRLRVERDVGGHLAVILEVDAGAGREARPPRGSAWPARPPAGRRSNRRAGRRAGRSRGGAATPAASTAMSASSSGVGMSCTAVSATSTGAPARQHQRDADDAMAGLRVDHPADIVEHDRIVAA